MKRFRLRLPLTCLVLLALLQGCGTPTTTPEQPVITDKDGRRLSEIEQLLLQAEQAAPLEKSEYTLQAAQRLFDEGQLDRSAELLATINPLMLSINREQTYWLLRARIEHVRLNPEQSLEWLSRITQPDRLPPDQQRILQQLDLDNRNLLGDGLAALDTLIERSALAADEERARLNNDIWTLLQRLSLQELENLEAQADNSYLQQGWYELALATRRSGTDILQSGQALASWQQLWNLHPAATQMPDQLLEILSQQAEPLSRIAILLPQSGPLAKPANAIIEGILAAQFQDQQLGRPTPELVFFDSEKISDPRQLYLSIDPQQYDLVIGPLAKQKLASLASQNGLAIPTLALNYHDEPGSTEGLYQFGLRGEDEAIQAARRAWSDGHRTAVSLTPATGWGQRIQTAFRDEWQALGGIMAAQQDFTGDNDFSEKISTLLSIDESQQRLQQLRRYVSERIEFEPRRRQDIDFVFLSALAQDARQIKPTLAFHYASQLPVYATSHIYSGDPSTVKDQDLNGILFCDIPWILNENNPIKANLKLYRSDTESRFGKLYALGSDAYRIATYLKQLQAVRGSHLQGQSGRLSVDPQGRIVRYLDWARFSNGVPKRLDN